MEDGDEASKNEETASEPDRTPEGYKGRYFASLVGRSQRRTLHRGGECHRVPGVHYKRFEDLGEDLPPEGMYHRVCKECFPRGVDESGARCPPRSQHLRSRWTSLFHPPFFRSTQTKRGRQEKDRRGADSLGKGGAGSVRLMHNFTCRRMRNRASCHASGRSGQRDCSMQHFWAACKSGS